MIHPIGLLAPKEIIPTDGLIAYYPFNGNANDESGNGNNGTVTDAILTTDRKGSANRAYLFNESSYINVNYNAVLYNSVFSYSVWVYINSNPLSGNAMYIVDSWNTVNPRIDAVITFNNGSSTKFELLYNYGAGTSVFRSSISPVIGDWYHLVMIHGAANDKIYINGSLDASASYRSGSFVAGIASLTPDLRFGLRLDDGYGFNGKIDNIIKYNRELTASEVTALYNE